MWPIAFDDHRLSLYPAALAASLLMGAVAMASTRPSRASRPASSTHSTLALPAAAETCPTVTLPGRRWWRSRTLTVPSSKVASSTAGSSPHGHWRRADGPAAECRAHEEQPYRGDRPTSTVRRWAGALRRGHGTTHGAGSDSGFYAHSVVSGLPARWMSRFSITPPPAQKPPQCPDRHT